MSRRTSPSDRRRTSPAGDSGHPPEDVERLGPEADPESVARKILLDQLTGQARSRAELATKLRRKGVPDAVGEPLLDRFEEVGLVDDAAFAQEWVQSRQAGRGLARRALKVELQRKGVDTAVIAEAVETVDDDLEAQTARELVRRKLPSLARFDEHTRIRRLTGMLARKGYSAGVAYAAIRRELTDAASLLDDVE